MNPFRNLNPRQKKIALALLAAGGLALITIFGRGRSGGTAAATDTGALATPTYGSAGTFADNGAQASGLSSDVTAGLGDVAVALDQLPDLVGAAVAANTPVYEVPTSPSPDEWAAAFAGAMSPIAQASTPSGTPNSSSVKKAASAKKTATAAQTKAAAKPNVAFQDTGPRAGLNFKTVTKDKKVFRFYESKPGKGDFGAAKNSKIYVRPASK